MIPGEFFHDDDDTIELNADRPVTALQVNNTGDRPIQVGAHYHFFEVNKALVFDRTAAYGQRLDLPAGTAVRFEPGEIKTVNLVPFVGERRVYGGSGLVMGALDNAGVKKKAFQRLREQSFGDTNSTADSPAAASDKKAAKKSKSRK